MISLSDPARQRLLARGDHGRLALEEIVTDQVWGYQYPVCVGPLKLMARMTVVRLRTGAIWVHSPAPLTDQLREELTAIGLVHHVVAPNKSHYLHFKDFLANFPGAQGYIAPGLQRRLAPHDALRILFPGSDPWPAEIDTTFVSGLPLIDESLFYHRSSRSLIVTDLFAYYGPRQPSMHRVIAGILGVRGRLATSRTMRLAISDYAALSQSLAPLYALPIVRVIVGHGDLVVKNASASLKLAIASLSPLRRKRALAVIRPLLPERSRGSYLPEEI
jgi:Domain of unknown function (DUF4336)